MPARTRAECRWRTRTARGEHAFDVAGRFGGDVGVWGEGVKTGGSRCARGATGCVGRRGARDCARLDGMHHCGRVGAGRGGGGGGATG